MTHTHGDDRCIASDHGKFCTKKAPHPGERHKAEFPVGSYTWGYEPTAEETQCTSNIADVDEDFAPARCVHVGLHDTHHGPSGEVWL